MALSKSLKAEIAHEIAIEAYEKELKALETEIRTAARKEVLAYLKSPDFTKTVRRQFEDMLSEEYVMDYLSSTEINKLTTAAVKSMFKL